MNVHTAARWISGFQVRVKSGVSRFPGELPKYPATKVVLGRS